MNILKTCSLAFICILLAGCTGATRYNLRSSLYEPFQSGNFYSENHLPEHVRRVVLMPIYSQDLDAKTLQSLDQTFRAELQRAGRFEVINCFRDQLHDQYGISQLSSSQPYPEDIFDFMHFHFNADAILFIDLTQYQAYRPIMLGIRGRLIELNTGRTVWAADDVFDSGSPHVQVAARAFEDSYERIGYPLNEGSSILRSPLRYSKYVAFELFQQIPDKK